ncbi:proline dehydrogenase family protein [Jeongeupia naejangsanensis]|uniref:Bifunctional protein PutA n=1 Tax=Jeongeupia naejangsanensis TaxID=613195 RepID=A0ABS2BGD1_9NEIS|nr:proline dehydrogenase family protein [Jeongeupia naejangsanensis]MBM3114661.1 proline dehydrogenase family protein [Jeongeupia naejangsanensis]
MPATGRITPFDLAQTHFADETHLVRRLLPLARLSADENTSVQRYAPLVVEQLREQHRRGNGFDALLAGFPHDSPSGQALLTLAEVLPRMPDDASTDRMIIEALHAVDWQQVNASSAVVRLARWTLVRASSWSEHERTEPLVRLGLRKALRELGRHFVIAERIDDALARRNPALSYSFGILGESAQTQADVDRYETACRDALLALSSDAAARKSGISLKLSALHPRYEPRQIDRVRETLWPRLRALAQLAHQHDIPLTIDAEESDRLLLGLMLFERLLAEPALANWDRLGITVQASQKRAIALIDQLVEQARLHQRRFGIRLVKGAYWDDDIRQAQREGWADYPAFTRKSHTDISYLACARRLLDAGEIVVPVFATHNVDTALAVHAIAAGRPFEYQCLFGLGESLYDLLPGHGLPPCQIYAPVGDEIARQPYLIRRLLENSANNVVLQRLLASDEPGTSYCDPMTDALAHPEPALPPPCHRADGDLAATGICWSDATATSLLAQALAPSDRHTATPTYPAPEASRSGRVIFESARPDVCLGHTVDASDADIDFALTRASSIAPVWAATPPDIRANCVNAMADALVENRATLLHLLVREAGRTPADALAEWREAVALCRQHARHVQEEWGSPKPLGIVAVLGASASPLATFVSHIAAALVAGNPVLAKPASPTALIAAAVIAAGHMGGLDRDVLQLLPGGATVGARLVADPRIGGVVSAGSAATAHALQRSLARHEALKLLLAKSGGLNTLIADTSTCTEHVVRDAITSAFSHAGQHASALRLLCIPYGSANELIARLHAAMAELRLGDPAATSTDVGPLISASVAEQVQANIAALHRAGYPGAQHGIVDGFVPQTLVAPTLVEIDRPDALPAGFTGPVLAVLRYAPEQLPALLSSLDTCMQGGSLAIYSRGPHFIDAVRARIRSDAIHINCTPTGSNAWQDSLVDLMTRDGDPFRPGAVDPAIQQLAERLHRLVDRDCEPDKTAVLHMLIDDTTARSPVGRHEERAAPAGERQTRMWRPLGLIACLGHDATMLRQQLIVVLLTGNTAVLPDLDAPAVWASELAGHCQIAPDPLALPIVACLCATPPTVAFKQHLAQRGDTIVSLITPIAQNRYPLHRLVSETAVWETLASGCGSADLLDTAK